MDEDLGLNLNLNLDQVGGSLSHPKVDWRERKRQAHAKRNNRRQRQGQARSQPTPAAAAPSASPAAAAAAAATAEGSPSKRQRVQHTTTASGHRTDAATTGADSMHGYAALATDPQLNNRHTQQQQQQQQEQQLPSLKPQQQPGHTKGQASTQPAKRSTTAAGGSAGSRPTVVKGALTKLQESAEAAGPSQEEEADIMALVQLNLTRDQQLQQEVMGAAAATRGRSGAGRHTAHQAPVAGVVEFGDVEDEPDYQQLAAHKQQHKQHGGQATGSNTKAGGRKHASSGKADKQQQQAQKPQPQKLTQLKTGELTHAEPNVPAESRLQLFGAAGAGGAAAAAGVDDSSWSGLGLSEVLSGHLEALNFQEPTQVQKHSIPVLLSGRDALVRSPTGSGKTLAYLAPMVHALAAAQPRITRADGTYGVVLVPTRELAVQVSDVLTALVRRFCWLVPGILIGGEHRGHEKARLRKGVTVLVATPGRLMDHLENTTSFKTDHLSWLVLDEADRLLDLGFEAKLKAIVAAFDSRSIGNGGSNDGEGGSSRSRTRQTVLLSATLHPGLSVLAGLSLHDPVGVGFKAKVVDGQLQLAAEGAAEGDLGSQQAGGKAPAAAGAGGQEAFELPQQLKQKYVEVDAKMRLVYLIGVLQSRLRRSKASKMVVFFSNCDSVDFHHELFGRELELAYQHHGGQPQPYGGAPDTTQPVKLLGSVPVLKLHGDMRQPERTSSLVTFAKAKSCVLLCTDVAARGLDFPSVSTIIQYDPAGDPAEYVHRVGRTARMGQQGEALLFLLHSEMLYVDLLQQRGMQLQQERPDAVLRCLPSLLSEADSGAAGSVHRLAKKLRQEAAEAGGAAGSGAAAGGGGSSGRGRGSRSKDTAAGAAGAGGAQLSGAQAEGQAAGLMLQRQLVQVISGDDELKQLALSAFRSYIRAYATHPSFLKHVFHIKSLHLGHLAASFGLKEAPTRIGASGASAERKKRKAQEHKASQKRQKAAWHKAAKAAVADG